MNIIKAIIRQVLHTGIIFKVCEKLSYIQFKKLIKQLQNSGDLKLHLGCGSQVLADWINVDAELSKNVLTMKLPCGLQKLDNNSARYIYTSHFLEHLEYPSEALEFVTHCHRILAPEGCLRVAVPGIEKIIRAYALDNQMFFKLQEKYHPSWCKTKLEHLMYALQQDGEHRYGYDFETIEKLLSQAGFTKITCSNFNQSQFEDLRVDYRAEKDEIGEFLSLYVEAIKE
ncbi:MAG: methyltransferase domain-containing protein [Synechococcales cyanobacterium CRU_2_2]|nr:methyltransferase domain-containing protein [Synechococcales cyanobacterium CRU_2_2]